MMRRMDQARDHHTQYQISAVAEATQDTRFGTMLWIVVNLSGGAHADLLEDLGGAENRQKQNRNTKRLPHGSNPYNISPNHLPSRIKA